MGNRIAKQERSPESLLPTPAEATRLRVAHEQRLAARKEKMLRTKVDQHLARITEAMKGGLTDIEMLAGETPETWKEICSRVIPLLEGRGFYAKAVVGTNRADRYRSWLVWETDAFLPTYERESSSSLSDPSSGTI